MVCEHLAAVEQALIASGARITFRGAAWSKNCREWVYFDGFLDTQRIRERFPLAACVRDHTHRGTHDGQEHGLVCEACHDALMGDLEPKAGGRSYPD